MNLSQGAVHPVEAPQPQTEGAANAPHHRARMKDLQGMPGTVGGLVLRVSQLLSAVVALSVMATTSDFSSASAFRYLVAAVGLQSAWSFVLAIVDAYALLAGRRLQNSRILSLFAVGDGITSSVTFASACASAGVTVLISNDLGACRKNHCAEFETATAMAFLSWFGALPSFLLNFWTLASK
ncbi:CASP-like protein 5A2 [Primulina tabacum]|uniref:CASP-like protein 5A2 n=1 Tax=Primulina tabacum TaxID=48773 RepID=UPI003F5A8475